jgi:hypothetical protein
MRLRKEALLTVTVQDKKASEKAAGKKIFVNELPQGKPCGISLFSALVYFLL